MFELSLSSMALITRILIDETLWRYTYYFTHTVQTSQLWLLLLSLKTSELVLSQNVKKLINPAKSETHVISVTLFQRKFCYEKYILISEPDEMLSLKDGRS